MSLTENTAGRHMNLQLLKEKWAHTGFQKYLKNTGWMFFANISYLIASFFSVIFVARELGPTNYGELSYALSFVALFGFIVGLGTSQILYRELVRDPENKNLYLGTAFRITLVSAFFAQILVILIALLFSPKDVSFWSIFILSFSFIFNAFYVIAYEFQAEIKSKWPSITITSAHFLIAILKIIIVLMGQGVLYLSIVILFEGILIALGLIYFRYKKYGSLFKWKYNNLVAKKMLRDSTPLIVVSAFTLIYSKIDQVMIKNMINAEAVGLYDAAVRLSELWYFIPTTIIASLFPAMVNADKISHSVLINRIKKIGIFLFGISALVAIFVTLSSDFLVRIIFGIEFMESSMVLKIYVWSLIATSISLLLNQYLITKNFRKTIILISFVGMSTNIILNAILIPRYGIEGAAWATFISYFIPLILILFYNKLFKFKFV